MNVSTFISEVIVIGYTSDGIFAISMNVSGFNFAGDVLVFVKNFRSFFGRN